MDDLKKIMHVVDEHSHLLPEGAYLEICQRLRNLYSEKENTAPTTLFDYSAPIVSLHGPEERSNVDAYFEDVYLRDAVNNDIEFLEHSLEYLHSLREECEPIQRLSKYTKMYCVRHFCEIHNIELEEYSQAALRKYCEANNFQIGQRGESFDKAFIRICHGYKVVENRFRNRFKDNIDAKVEQIEGLIDELYEIA